MIFLTVGTQLPFDRLVRAVDDWAGRTGRSDIVAQIGPSELSPRHLQFQRFVSPAEFVQHLTAADLIISHAGMGSIIHALELGKPILVMPRRADLDEHRNDHQLATARRFLESGRIMVAMDEYELSAQLEVLRRPPPGPRIGRFATDGLLSSVRNFIES